MSMHGQHAHLIYNAMHVLQLKTQMISRSASSRAVEAQPSLSHIPAALLEAEVVSLAERIYTYIYRKLPRQFYIVLQNI